MIQELEKLSSTMDFVTEADAKAIIHSVNEAIAKLLNAHVIDVLWKQEGQGGMILQPFYSFDTTARRGAKPFQLRGADDDPPGVWTWVYEQGKRSKAKTTL